MESTEKQRALAVDSLREPTACQTLSVSAQTTGTQRGGVITSHSFVGNWNNLVNSL